MIHYDDTVWRPSIFCFYTVRYKVMKSWINPYKSCKADLVILNNYYPSTNTLNRGEINTVSSSQCKSSWGPKSLQLWWLDDVLRFSLTFLQHCHVRLWSLIESPAANGVVSFETSPSVAPPLPMTSRAIYIRQDAGGAACLTHTGLTLENFATLWDLA